MPIVEADYRWTMPRPETGAVVRTLLTMEYCFWCKEKTCAHCSVDKSLRAAILRPKDAKE
jgi:hypothetical protein